MLMARRVLVHDRSTNQRLSCRNVFWFGDFNYRNRVTRDFAFDNIKMQDWDNLQRFDQLNEERAKKRVFEGFIEPRIAFGPTYKFDPDTDNWDSSEKQRTPSWCDRILFRGDGIAVLAYSSHPEFTISDHKPVSGLFLVVRL